MPITFSVQPATDRDVAVTVTLTLKESVLRDVADRGTLVGFLANQFDDAIIIEDDAPYAALKAL